jgi:hypothetical protein
VALLPTETQDQHEEAHMAATQVNISEELRKSMARASEAYEKDHPLYRQKCEQKLHHVKDRAELVEDCSKSAEDQERSAAFTALEALKYEETGDFEDAQRHRMMAMHHYDTCRRFRALSYGLAPFRVDERSRMAPYEADALRLVDEVWLATAHAEWLRTWEQTERLRAERAILVVRLAQILGDSGRQSVTPEEVLEVEKLGELKLQKLAWLFLDGSPVVHRETVCERITPFQVSVDRLQEKVRCAECCSEWRGSIGVGTLRKRLGLAPLRSTGGTVVGVDRALSGMTAFLLTEGEEKVFDPITGLWTIRAAVEVPPPAPDFVLAPEVAKSMEDLNKRARSVWEQVFKATAEAFVGKPPCPLFGCVAEHADGSKLHIDEAGNATDNDADFARCDHVPRHLRPLADRIQADVAESLSPFVGKPMTTETRDEIKEMLTADIDRKVRERKNRT